MSRTRSETTAPAAVSLYRTAPSRISLSAAPLNSPSSFVNRSPSLSRPFSSLTLASIALQECSDQLSHLPRVHT